MDKKTIEQALNKGQTLEKAAELLGLNSKQALASRIETLKMKAVCVKKWKLIKV